MAFLAYLLDIEGTTTPIDFVTKTLFPYARAGMREFLAQPDAALEADLELLAKEAAGEQESFPFDRANPAEYLFWLMDHDRKSTALKSIQGRIWARGYAAGVLKGEVYPDVEPALDRWKGRGAKVAIFSSGSVLGQKLLFGHLPTGDWTSRFDGFFDTTTGAKRSADAYSRIVSQLAVDAEKTLFLSDILEEVTAAREAGLTACQVLRGGGAIGFPESVQTFDEVP